MRMPMCFSEIKDSTASPSIWWLESMVATGSRTSVSSGVEVAGKGDSTADRVSFGFFLDGIKFGSVNACSYLIKIMETLPALFLRALRVSGFAFPLISTSLCSNLIKTHRAAYRLTPQFLSSPLGRPKSPNSFIPFEIKVQKSWRIYIPHSL